jgi:hypothetical protein
MLTRAASASAAVAAAVNVAPPMAPGVARLGRAGSLNAKKSSPNRVCCNALLAAYARATPPRWRQALKLLEVGARRTDIPPACVHPAAVARVITTTATATAAAAATAFTVAAVGDVGVWRRACAGHCQL